MGRHPLEINEHYFDRRRRTTEEKIAMYYMLGAFYAGYSATKKVVLKRSEIPTKTILEILSGFCFRSEHEDLVEIVRRELECQHAKTSESREGKSSHWIKVSNAPYLCERLKEFGLDVPKDKRGFPTNIPKRYLGHFIRGYFDAKALIKIIDNKRNEILIWGNPAFVSGLNEILTEVFDIEGSLNKRCLFFGSKKSIRLYKGVLYKKDEDWDFVEEKGLYLPFKKERFKDYKTTKFS